MKIGVICPSEIAIRRFMPALQFCEGFTFAGVGVCTKEERFASQNISAKEFQRIFTQQEKKANKFTKQYGGIIYSSYEAVVTSDYIDAVYIPLPPALHYKWAKIALEHGKHVFIEKPSTIFASNTSELVRIAEGSGLALHENYMFVFHKQLDAIDNIIKDGEIGDVRLYRICFGFPMRAANDFRYNKALGGGSLIDAGGYTIRYAMRLLGQTAAIQHAQSNYIDGFEVDMYGSATLTNADGVTAQIAFGLDNNYKCELEVWGSKGCLTTGRVLTAPVGFKPTVTIRKGNDEVDIELPADDAFLNSMNHFIECIMDEDKRKENYAVINKQAKMIEEFKIQAGWNS